MGPATRPQAPVRQLEVIGIGPGDPSLVTAEAAAAIAATDVFVVIDKGDDGADLNRVRHEVLERYAVAKPFRVLAIEDAVRDATLPYAEAVARWHAHRASELERALVNDVDSDETCAILVWGDPSLYDSTLRMIDRINERGRVFLQHRVLPGISCIQLLTARHRIPLNRIGGSVLITTGRRLGKGVPVGDVDVVVMLDADTTFTRLVGLGFEIYWGAYLGSPDELLVAGPLDEVADEIVRIRAAARSARGWIFDTYLLRRLGS